MVSAGDNVGSVALLRFMAWGYPNATAVREGLLYGLFLQRAGLDQADPQLTTDIDRAISELRSLSNEPPIWIDLVETQQRIDKGDPGAARESLARFLEQWTGEPAGLTLYVEDLHRYLTTH